MPRRTVFTIIVPIVTFVLGVLVQALLSQWITFTNVFTISLIVIMIILVAIFVILEVLDRRFDSVDNQLLDIANRTGLRIDYIEDGVEGKSYLRTTELIENAKLSVTAVANWEPFPHYNVDNTSVNSGVSEVINARRRYYNALKKQIQSHRDDDSPFHRRIIQVPIEYMNNRIPFEVDPTFKEHLLFIVKMKENGSRACILRKSTAFIKTDFTLIDDQYVIMPIMTTVKNVVQARYGAIIVNDTEGRLVRRLKSIYWDLENRAKPIEVEEVEP